MGGSVLVAVRDRLAMVTLDAAGAKVNLLRREFLRELEATAEKLRQTEEIDAAIVYSAKAGGFIAGADIGEIERITDPDEATALAAEGQRIFGLWPELPFPVVAAVNGVCLGGGTEFLLACHFRIAADTASLALPEVRLGIFPGFGGTQRLPRLIPLAKALDVILSGRTIRPREALAIGLVDRVVPEGDLVAAAEALARQVAKNAGDLLLARRRRRRGDWKTFLLQSNPVGRALLFRMTRGKVLEKTGGHYPAPLLAIEAVRRGLTLPLAEGLALEARLLGPVASGPVCKNLIHVFHLSQRPKKRAPPETAPLHRAAVLGAGVMGSGISQLLAGSRIPVLLKDIDPATVSAGLERARKGFRRQARRKDEEEGWVASRMAMITGTTEYEGFDDVDLTIEAVVEKMPVKQQVLRDVEPLLKPQSVFATNTSALSVSELQTAAARPDRVAGMHFFNPVDRMPLVEIIQGERTSASTIDFLFAQALRIGKTPVLAADRPGFLVNRLLMAYLNEAALLAEEGVDRISIDRLATGFGWPMGPFRLLDEIGIDIAAEVGDTLCRAFPYLPPNSVLRGAAAAGLLGKKGSRGFYLYHDGKAVRSNQDADRRLALKPNRQAGEGDLLRMLYLMVNEAGRTLAEGVIAEPADVDTGMVFGTGFPPFRGGLCRWADQEGIAAIVARLEGLAARHGPRFSPSPFLRGRRSFYS
jgi:3-hydroxyacyl-CoA dehydrogenase/enoyl-CoA hydratase/3-hydroxybutyryl-CoA epimerase